MEDGWVIVAKILCGVGVADIDSHHDVDRLFAVEQIQGGGFQLGAKMFQVEVQIWEMFGDDDRHLPDLTIHRILMSHRLERGHFNILLLPITNLSTTECTITLTPSMIFTGTPSEPVLRLQGASCAPRHCGFGLPRSPKPPDDEPKNETSLNVSSDAESKKMVMMKWELAKWDWKVKLYEDHCENG